MSLRDEVDQLLPNWRQWYPSLFDAAADLGLIRARVCSPGSLLLRTRHADIRRDAEDAHREKWGGGPAEDPPDRSRDRM
jgi:hypothetical protein